MTVKPGFENQWPQCTYVQFVLRAFNFSYINGDQNLTQNKSIDSQRSHKSEIGQQAQKKDPRNSFTN